MEAEMFEALWRLLDVVIYNDPFVMWVVQVRC